MMHSVIYQENIHNIVKAKYIYKCNSDILLCLYIFSNYNKSQNIKHSNFNSLQFNNHSTGIC